MSSLLNIILASRDGTTLSTEGTYCDKNIKIVPLLMDKTVAATKEEQIITVEEGYAGIGSVTVEAMPEYEGLVTIGGEPVEVQNGIIKVEELPTENVDPEAVYQMTSALRDVIMNEDGQIMSYSALAAQYGMKISFHTIPTKTTENILPSGDEMHVYFIRDEEDIFIYDTDNGWMALYESMSGDATLNKGTIIDISQATETGYYALLGDGPYYKYFDVSLTDVVIGESGVIYETLGALSAGLYYVATKPKEDIRVTDLNSGFIYLYYVEDENDVFIYGDIESTGTNSWVLLEVLFSGGTPLTFCGVITDASQITDMGYYAIVVDDGFQELIAQKDIYVPTSEERTVTPQTYQQEITPYDSDYLSKVTVEPIPDSYAKVSGTKTVTTNGTHDVKSYENVEVNVPIPEVPDASTSEERTVTPTKETQEITPQNADYLSKVIVEPIPDNYAAVSGSLTITENGTYDVTNKKTAVVTTPSVYTADSIDDVPANAPNGSIALIWEVIE